MKEVSLDSLSTGLQIRDHGPSSLLEGLIDKEQQERALIQMAKLTPQERKALRAYMRIDGNSCRAVAEQLGVSHQTVCNWAITAIRKLKSHLGDYE